MQKMLLANPRMLFHLENWVGVAGSSQVSSTLATLTHGFPRPPGENE